MARLLSGLAIFCACTSLFAQAVVQQEAQSAPDETALLFWILIGILFFFGGVGLFTWHLIKSERQRRLETRPPE